MASAGSTRSICARHRADDGATTRHLIRGVLGLVALWPVSILSGKIRSRLSRKVRRDVEGVLAGQGIVLAERHVGLDEGGGRVQSGHASADVERLRTPKRREQILALLSRTALTIGAMAGHALFQIE